MEQALVSALAGAGPGDVGSEDAARAYLARTADARPKRYGGDTTCVEFQNAGGGRVLVDFGSGARRFGLEAMKSDRPISALMTHMHWDHVQGFPFFVPAFIPGRKLVIGGGHRPAALESALMSQFDTPFFPVPRSTVKADVDFFPVTAGEPFEFEGFTITAFLLNHGGGSYGYRFDYDGASVVFASDAEHDPNDITPDYAYVHWAEGADALIFDSQYMFDDLVLHREDWGHSNGLVAVDLCHLADIPKVVLTHHDPAGTDARIEELLEQTREYEEMRREAGADLIDIQAAYDDMVFDID